MLALSGFQPAQRGGVSVNIQGGTGFVIDLRQSDEALSAGDQALLADAGERKAPGVVLGGQRGGPVLLEARAEPVEDE